MKFSDICQTYLGMNFISHHCDYSHSLCLNINDVKVNWNTANSTFASQGRRPFNPEFDVIGRNGIPGNTEGEFYWTEIYRDPQTKYFQTQHGKLLQNGRHLDNYPWKPEHPIDSMDCVGFDGESHQLLSLVCNHSHLAVCGIGK